MNNFKKTATPPHTKHHSHEIRCDFYNSKAYLEALKNMRRMESAKNFPKLAV